MKCEICGKEIEKSKYWNAVLCSSECYEKHFWLNKIKHKNDLNIARINGVHYYIGEENTYGMRGFDGAMFIIKFFDGRIVHTTNLWTQGKIPDEYIKELPDNAEFI